MAAGAGPKLKLYNTLTRRKDDFTPIDPADVRMYVCGPTVYDFAHVGNARPVIVFDVLYRLLRHVYGDGHVTYVRNITDVDDKINARALRDYPTEPLNDAIRKVTEKTAAQFHRDVAALGCLPPTIEPRATDFVLPREDGKADMASLIQTLIDRGHAYESKGEILFDVASMPDYGRLSNRRLEDQQAGARVAVEAHKKNPGDFVLWKASSADEPGWDGEFRLGERSLTIRGRPGWHIECSAMSAAYLGDVFDIHGGGLDLIFPHHENEIAQSRCAHGTDVMANVWMHNGFLQVEGRKMSKSEGNFVTIYDLLHTEKFGGRKWPGEVLRLAMLMTHYREPIDFSVSRLQEAYGLHRVLTNVTRYVAPSKGRVIPEVVDSLLDDMNTSAAIQTLIKTGAKRDIAATADFLGLTSPSDRQRAEAIEKARSEGTRDAVHKALEDDDAASVGLSREFLENKKNERLAFLREKNFAEADRIRDELAGRGIQLKDAKDPETGERLTTWEVKR